VSWPVQYAIIKAFSETEFADDPKKPSRRPAGAIEHGSEVHVELRAILGSPAPQAIEALDTNHATLITFDEP